MTTPKLRKGDRANFQTFLRAADDGALALVSAIRKADQQPVALVCAMQTNPDDEKWGHLIVVSDEDLGDYDPEDCHFGPSGQVLDLDWLLIHGQEGTTCPYPCTYHGDGLPEEGIAPADYSCRDEGDLGTPPSGAEEEQCHVQNPHR